MLNMPVPVPTGHQSPAPPFSDGVNPALRYDDAGNSYIRGTNGEWIPHHGYAKVLPLTSRHASQQESDTRGQWPSEPMSQAFEHLCASGIGLLTLPPLCPATFAHAADGLSNTTILAATVPLSLGPDNDLIDPQIIASSCGYIPSPKVAGARCPGKDANSTVNDKRSVKGKGKEKENVGSEKLKKRSRAVIELDDDDDDLLPAPNAKAKHGHPQGANNYTTRDTTTLLDCIEVELPLGQRGWQAITPKFNKWAVKSARPERKVTSLEMKFKQLVKTSKPTGDGVDFNDTDVDGKTHNWSDEEDELKPERRTAVARSLCSEAPPTRRNACGAAAADLMMHLSTAFDPAVQRARDEEHTNRSLANMQYLTLAQQLHDSQATSESLCSQLSDVRNQLYEAQCKCDRAEMCLEMMQSRRPREVGMYHNLPKHKHSSYRWFADDSEDHIEWPPSDDDDGVLKHAKD
ncbi:hypothetical protein HD554DRAFT_2043477 [Boletus coccyginus]|nr:hypothetical protein HD554DRAFT_2043477 [Boletus coccyginus]